MPSRIAFTSTLAAVLMSTACAFVPIVKRTALVPAPAGPSLEGRPLSKGEVRLTGGFNPIATDPASSSDAGLYIPTAQLAGAASFGMTDHLELSAQASFAPYAWAEPTGDDVFGLPGGGQLASTTAGLGFRWMHQLGEHPLWLGFSGELNVARVPQAVWVQCGCGSWKLDHYEQAEVVLPDTYVQFGWAGGEHVYMNVIQGFTTGVANEGTGYGASEVNDSTLSPYLMPVIGTGVEVRFGRLRLESDFLLPTATATIDFGPQLVLRASAVL